MGKLKKKHIEELKQLLKEHRSLTEIKKKIQVWKDEGYNVDELEEMIASSDGTEPKEEKITSTPKESKGKIGLILIVAVLMIIFIFIIYVYASGMMDGAETLPTTPTMACTISAGSNTITVAASDIGISWTDIQIKSSATTWLSMNTVANSTPVTTALQVLGGTVFAGVTDNVIAGDAFEIIGPASRVGEDVTITFVYSPTNAILGSWTVNYGGTQEQTPTMACTISAGSNTITVASSDTGISWTDVQIKAGATTWLSMNTVANSTAVTTTLQTVGGTVYAAVTDNIEAGDVFEVIGPAALSGTEVKITFIYTPTNAILGSWTVNY